MQNERLTCAGAGERTETEDEGWAVAKYCFYLSIKVNLNLRKDISEYTEMLVGSCRSHMY